MPYLEIERRDLAEIGNRRCCVERPATGEHRQATKQRAFGVAQEVVAPGDGFAQRLLALRQIGRSSRKQRDRLVEAREQRGRGQEAAPGSGQLDGQGQEVEPAADPRHDFLIRAPDRRGHLGGPLPEQIHRSLSRKGRDAVQALPLNLQRRSAGGKDLNPRGSG